MDKEPAFFVTVGIITGLMFGFELVEEEDDGWIFILDFAVLRLMISKKALV